MFKRLIFLTSFVLVFVVAFAFSTTAMAADIAISTQANWWGQAAADREMQEIADNVTAASVEQFTADQQDALADWVVAHTGNGVSDLLILCGAFPATIYAPGNAQPDGSLAELFLDDGNCIINTGDWMFYVVIGGTNNAEGGLWNMMDIPDITMWDDNTPVVVTAEGQAYTPSLVDYQTDRPFHLDELEGAWYVELVLAQNAAGTRAEPVIVANAATGGRIGIFYQTNGQDDDPRGEVISEWINNWFLTAGDVLNSPSNPNPADGTVDADVLTLEWTAGHAAVSHKVYLSTDETIDESDLAGETAIALIAPAMDPGTTYYWRVDEIDTDGNVTEGDLWSFSTLPLEAHFPSPYDGSVNTIIAELSWAGGKNSIMHNIHFGTDPAILLPVSMMQMDTSYDPGALDPDTTYYWRVDEFTPAGIVTGPVWSFSTPPVIPITDPNLAGWWKFDEGEGLTALDSSGHGGHGSLIGGPQWVDGLEGMALEFSGSGQYVNCGNEAGAGVTADFTLTAWVQMAPDSAGQYMGIGGKLLRSGDPYTGFSLVRHSSNVFRLWVGQGTSSLSSVNSNVTYTDTDWHHVTGVREGQTNILYVDGMRQAATTESDFVPSSDFFHIGRQYSHLDDRYFEGIIDEVMLYDYAISDEDIRLMGGDLTLPYSPDPADGAGDVPADTVLAWIPGDDAVEQDVYLGTDAGAVAAADIYDNTGIYRGRQAETAYIPDDLADYTTYYWRADQVSVDGSTTCITTGPVWSFTTLIPIPITDPNMLLYYDFESGEGSLALDQSGHSNHGLFFGNPEWATGIFGGALAIESDEVDYIETEAPLNIVSNTVTVTGWVKHDETPVAWSGILTNRGSDPGCLGLQQDGTELRYMWGADQYWSFSSGLLIPNGEWYFAALTISPEQGKLYLNGVEQTATNVAEHVPTNFDGLISVGRDIGFGGDRIMTSLIDEVRLYNKTLTDVEILKLMGSTSDVTAPGDIVQGVPNDGDWPPNETPPMVIDDDSGTKYLHFKGSDEPTGFQIEPASGPSIVTGLTLTTANDAIERDPISYELSGSNDSIDGPYELIASGDIVDFAQATAWPRFTMNATPISFDNDVAYKYYQVMFPTVRDAASANSMQIAEVELLGVPGPVFVEDFESYAVGTDLHGVNNWEGWEGAAGAGAPVSDAFAYSGSNSVEIISSADLVKVLDFTGGSLTLTAMQYIPSGTTGDTFFILMNQYAPNPLDWSPQTKFTLDSGQINDGQGTIVYDQWVELKYVIDLDNNTVDEYYNGVVIRSGQWDNDAHNTLQAIDLYSAGASSVYYDDITITRP